jgi:hypothetical protein
MRRILRRSRAAEEAILSRRPKWKDSVAERLRVGFGLSGGGIRSATFCLGVFQGLAKLGLLGEIDYTSSVSGGSYFGGFYGRLFTRPDVASAATGQTISPDIAKILAPEERERESFTEQQDPFRWKRGAFRWLRENGRYLSPRGGGDLLLAVAVFLRNWLTIQLIMWESALYSAVAHPGFDSHEARKLIAGAWRYLHFSSMSRSWRHRERQHLRHRPRVDPKASRRFPLTDPLLHKLLVVPVRTVPPASSLRPPLPRPGKWAIAAGFLLRCNRSIRLLQ